MSSSFKKGLFIALVPPISVCVYGCARCCAAPIGVFWISGIGAIIYGLLGGPANLDHISWVTVVLGVGLWSLASLWAYTVVKNTDDPRCEQKQRPNICRIINGSEDDPLDNVKKFY